MTELGATMRVIYPAPHIVGFYDGRIDGKRLHSDTANWLDDGAFTLGICSYVIVDGNEALAYDTHMSKRHAAIIRQTLESMGVTTIRVVLSHWHTDHVAGNEVFADCEIIANRLTATALIDNKDVLENGDPPIKPLIMPNRLFEDTLDLTVGCIKVELRQADIHSQDGTVILLPEIGMLLAGDTLEDPITYVCEPDRLQHHIADLRRIAGWTIDRILPSHGALETIESGGYGIGFIEANRRYVEKLARCRSEATLADEDLRSFAKEELRDGSIAYFAAYEVVHRRNIAALMGTSRAPKGLSAIKRAPP